MRLLAISDLHLGHAANRQALDAVPGHPEDWLIVAGDIGEKDEHFVHAFRTLVPRFRRVLWVPGNHDLWTSPGMPPSARGDVRYARLVDRCREFGVLTPEDAYPVWPGDGPPTMIAPLFLLYDYSFRPDSIAEHEAVDWAREDGVLCADERYLDPYPFESRQAWCAARCRKTEGRLAAVPEEYRLVLVNHFPLRRDLVRLPRIPRFAIWCGTRRTENWHLRFPVDVVVSGHLHMRGTHWRDTVRFEEVSLGYPRQWRQERGVASYLREILPRRDQDAASVRTSG